MVPNVIRVLAMVLIVVAASVNGLQDYCAICPDHTMCLYQGIGSKCSPQLERGVNQSDVAAIINAHNTARQRVAQGLEMRGYPGPQPPAANMRMMTWSNELAKVAQRWADQCDFQMDNCRSVASQRSVSQAVYRSTSYPIAGNVTSPNWSALIAQWADHVEGINRTIIDAFHQTRVGLYTQLVWAKTHLVGCGYTVYKEAGHQDQTHQVYVCNYAPGGNQNMARVYKKGPPCSKCPEGTYCRNQRFPSLCAVDITEASVEERPTATEYPAV